jgi:prepilin-type N-terminal cleavage/methylation domain-containing protein
MTASFSVNRPQAGFTLVELLIAITVVILLSMAGVASIVTQPPKGRDAKRKADLVVLRDALEHYNLDSNCYPQAGTLTTDLKDYIQSSFPEDPKTGEAFYYDPLPGGATCHTSYWIYAKLENLNDAAIRETGCSSGCGPGNSYNYRVGSPNAQ